MPEIKFTLSTATVARVKNSFASAYNYDETKLSDETKEDFAKRMIKQYIKEVIQGQEREIMMNATKRQANDNFVEPTLT